MRAPGTLLLTRSDVAGLLTLQDCIAAVERAFRLHGEGKADPPGILGIHAAGGGFHIKAGLLSGDVSYFVAKTNANFPQNPKHFGLPTIQGVILLFDAERGIPLAVMDSIEITILRTGAATAVAARHLARINSRVATICGCGNQGRVQLRALKQVLPIEAAFAFDLEDARADRFAEEMSAELRIRVAAMRAVGEALRESDVCVTCTPSRAAFVHAHDVRPGTFVAGVGADSPEKQELDPALLKSSKVVADILEQCATIGDLHHAIEQGLMTREQVYAELGEVVAGHKPGRVSESEIIVFDSTGMALQDAAAAVAVYERAVGAGIGRSISFGDGA
jgi:alanine dehydrogenase